MKKITAETIAEETARIRGRGLRVNATRDGYIHSTATRSRFFPMYRYVVDGNKVFLVWVQRSTRASKLAWAEVIRIK